MTKQISNIAVLSKGIWRIPHLVEFLQARVVKAGMFSDFDAVAGWGLRPTTRRARGLAKRRGVPFLALEDGFLRSVGLGAKGYPPFSMVVDDLGIYYDSTRPSRLEKLIAEFANDEVLLADARKAMCLIRHHRLSKYNHAPDVCPPLPEGKRIMVVDQTAGDMSVVYGTADASVFEAMLQAALKENPSSTILVKTHPDVLAGKRQGYFTTVERERVVYVTADVSPMALLEQVDKVYVATSHMGFEALLLGKPVVCFGIPWYAGWGLTDDRHPRIGQLQGRRLVPKTLEQLFAAAYLQYTRYIHPETGSASTIFEVINYLIDARRWNEEDRGTLYCIGMSLWKRRIVAPFLDMPSARIIFRRSIAGLPDALPKDARLVVWGRSRDHEIQGFVARHDIPVWRMEDGFLRSVGLGSNLRRALSLVVDKAGIYYDSESPSALEQWLQVAQIGMSEIARANALREKLKSLRLSKYNVGSTFKLNERFARRRVLLVVGQVEDDASIRLGSPAIRSNRELLRTVREENREAFIVYKPHPDVVTGNRNGKIEDEGSSGLCDQVETTANIIDCIEAVDEIHTLTSLAGFEALLLGKIVHCYGQPFYAGWGLTTDHAPILRRARKISLELLIYGALIHYPRYIDPVSLQRISVERVIDLLDMQRRELSGKKLSLESGLIKNWRKLKELMNIIFISSGN